MSKLEVDKVTPQSGTTLTIGEAGDTTVINGLGTLPATIGSATQVLAVNAGATGLEYGTAATDLSNLNATNLTSGTIPDGRFPSILPAAGGQNLTSLQPAAIVGGTFGSINSANLTNLNATALTSGTLPDARFPATLPAVSGANLTNLPASGITMVDQFALTSTFSLSSGANQITANLARVNNGENPGFIGTGMTESSGVFTFPSTGIYLITFNAYVNSTGAALYSTRHIQVTLNNSSFQTATESDGNFYTGTSYDGSSLQYILDVTATANVKVQFRVDGNGTNTQLIGSSSLNDTNFTFIRLGDT